MAETGLRATSSNLSLPWRPLESEIIDALRQQGLAHSGHSIAPNSIYQSLTADFCLVGSINLTELAKALAQAGFAKAGVVAMKVDP